MLNARIGIIGAFRPVSNPGAVRCVYKVLKLDPQAVDALRALGFKISSDSLSASITPTKDFEISICSLADP